MKFLNIKNCTVVGINTFEGGIKLKTNDMPADKKLIYPDTMFITIWDTEKTPLSKLTPLFNKLLEEKTPIDINTMFKVSKRTTEKALDTVTGNPYIYMSYDLVYLSHQRATNPKYNTPPTTPDNTAHQSTINPAQPSTAIDQDNINIDEPAFN